MDDFQYVRTLRGAIYGKVALVRHQGSGGLYAVKMMSIAHMSAHTAIAGAPVREDGDAELRILRRLSGNRVFRYSSEASASAPAATWSVNPLWDASAFRAGDPALDDAPLVGGSRRDSGDRGSLLWLHKDFVDARSNARCLVFEFCPNGELFDHVAGRALRPERARSFFEQVARAVHFVHAHGVAHRDISLENVLVDAQLQCRLADFGLASERGATCSGRVGKAFYMAPEVLQIGPLECYDGLKADVWSLGVLLFIMVTGAPPFESAAETDARFRVVKHQGVGELLCLWQMENRVSGGLRDLLARMLTVDADARIPIDKVCSHPWVLNDGGAAPVGLENLHPESAAVAEPSVQQDGDDGADPSELRDKNAEQQTWQQLPGLGDPEDEQKELDRTTTASAKAPADAVAKTRRSRKRMKISIEPDGANLLLIGHSNGDEGLNASALCPVECDGTGGDERGGASQAPALAHEKSMWGGARQELSALFAPHSTPTAGPRVRASGGRKAALRNLCFTPATRQLKRDVSGGGSSSLAVVGRSADNNGAEAEETMGELGQNRRSDLSVDSNEQVDSSVE